ncbi:hypothetical protein Trydic_g17442 [Trypoxylus dichotomus]
MNGFSDAIDNNDIATIGGSVVGDKLQRGHERARSSDGVVLIKKEEKGWKREAVRELESFWTNDDDVEEREFAKRRKELRDLTNEPIKRSENNEPTESPKYCFLFSPHHNRWKPSTSVNHPHGLAGDGTERNQNECVSFDVVGIGEGGRASKTEKRRLKIIPRTGKVSSLFQLSARYGVSRLRAPSAPHKVPLMAPDKWPSRAEGRQQNAAAMRREILSCSRISLKSSAW